MTHDIDNFHHLGIISRDLAAAVERYEKLGFIFTPISLPKFPLSPGGAPEPVGVANRCAIFENSFLEMLGVVDAARWASITLQQRGPFDIDRPMARYQGLHVMHFASDDLEAVRTRLVQSHLNPSEIRPFQRLVDTPEGPQMMRAKSLSFAPGTHPEALVQIAQHETPDLALPRRFMTHPNGARALTEAILCVADPDHVAARYATYTAHAVRRCGAMRIIDLGRARLIVIHPDDLPGLLPGNIAPTVPFLAGFTVSADLAATVAFFQRSAVAFQRYDDRIIINAYDGCGAAVVFESPDAQRK